MIKIQASEYASRYELVDLCNAQGVRIAVEVGTDRGTFARKFIEKFEGCELLCIDPYKPYEWLSGGRTADLLMAVSNLASYSDKVRIIEEDSLEVAAKLPSCVADILDFVYLDGDHSYSAVSKDIVAWWERLQPGGILAGHDYELDDHPGVVKAVNELVEKFDLTLFIVSEYPKSWYVFKRCSH